ncbi:MAG: uncharacterized protein QOK28_346 [Actinomycetota bacterium]|jgi:predicted TIM-barrel fold metal-dependent hydrolase
MRDFYETHRLKWDGAVDADGHILEPSNLWENYIDPKFRDVALRVVKDENGLDELQINGQRSRMSRKGFPSTLAAMGRPDLGKMMFDPEVTYDNHAPAAATDAKERLKYLDQEHIDAAVIYTTTGLLWEAELEDAEVSQAYTKAYNRWICEWCSDSGGRLIPTAHLSLGDPAAAAKELERAVGEGARGCYVAPFTHDRKPLGHPDNDPVFAAAQALDVPFAIHPTFEPQWTKGERNGTWEHARELRLSASVQASDGVRTQFATLFDYAVFDKFPNLKVLVLESGGGWIGYWLDRMDGVYSHTVMAQNAPLKHKPSDYFRSQCWISCDPDERMIPALAERYGYDRFMWASDFPHADHTPEYILDLDELGGMFPDEHRRAFLGDNCRQLFKIDA